MSREEIESGLHDYLDIDKVIWLKGGLVEDEGTDGHSDNVVQFVAPGVALLQTMPDRDNPNFELCKENLRRLREARRTRRVENSRSSKCRSFPTRKRLTNPNIGQRPNPRDIRCPT